MIFLDDQITHFVRLSDIPRPAPRPSRRPDAVRDTATTGQPAPPPPKPLSAAEAAQAERDQWFQELVARCRAGRLLDSSIVLALDECQRTRAELDDAIEQSEPHEGRSASSPTANPKRVLVKECPMTEAQKREVKSEFDRAVKAQHDLHPNWPKSKCVSAVVTQNPVLHQRLLDAANS